MTFSEITRGPSEANLPESVDADRNGALVGGAHVPGQGCLCNCSMRASLNLGTIAVNYDDGIDSYSEGLTYVDYWAWVDASKPALGASEYVAYMQFSDAASGCDPRIIVIADYPPSISVIGVGAGAVTGIGAFNAAIEVTSTGLGVSGVIAFDGGSSQWILLEGFERPGRIIGSAVGTYTGDNGTTVVSSQTIGEWRDFTGTAP